MHTGKGGGSTMDSGCKRSVSDAISYWLLQISHEEVTELRLGAIAVLAATIYSVPAIALPQFQNHLMPQPAQITVDSGGLALDSTFAVEVPGVADARLNEAIDRAVRRIEMVAGLRHSGRGVASKTRLIVKVERLAAPVQSIDEDESYS